MAGTTTQSGTDAPIVRTGTPSPWAVFTVRRTPTTLSSNRGTDSPDSSISSFAVEREDADLHGKHDIKRGVLATGGDGRAAL
jgi:hypothetical protein